jgi:purine-nucleoside/S-methyl-5'-thioadenosine phosphorylase / adenosine deaminase
MQYAISPSVKILRVNRSPYRSIVEAMRGISVASNPSPMMVTLPKPSGGFRWVQLTGRPLDAAQGRSALVCEALEPFAAHFFTTRGWGLGEQTRAADGGWDEVASAARVDVTRLRRLRQVHGSDAATYKRGSASPAGATPEADIVLTDDPSLAVAVQTADCLPILIVDRRTGAVAAAHAGWRGLALRVPAVTVDRLASGFGSRAEDLLVAAGPAIGACCYEVGEDVRARFAEAGFPSETIARWFRAQPSALPANPPMRTLSATRRPDHWFFDGWSCAREQLESAGVPLDHIFTADFCTASHDGTFCSYRRDGAIAGRMAAVIRSQKLELRS